MNFLASSKVQTPDPRQACPPIGQRLIIAWDFPKSLFLEDLTMVATVRLWDNTEKVMTKHIDRKRDVIAFFFPKGTDCVDRRILTYKVQICSANGEEVEKWEHHFWTDLIEVGGDLTTSSRVHPL